MRVMVGEDGFWLVINKFDDTKFSIWIMQIEDYLHGKMLHLAI